MNFQDIPENLNVPLFFGEFDNSQANTATAVQRTLIIGQSLTADTGSGAVPVSSAPRVAQVCGSGSILHLMAQAYFANDISGQVYVLALADTADSMSAAAGKITVTSPPTATGVISLYVGGVRVQVTAMKEDTVSAVASALGGAINAMSSLPVTATAAEGVVSLKAKNKGSLGNDIDLRLNWLGAPGGESTPEGLVLDLTPMTGGKGEPAMADALAGLGDAGFDFIINPYTDTASLDAVKAFLSDGTGRWSYASQLYGHAFGALKGTYGTLTAAGEARNDQHATLLGVNGSPTPACVWSAAVTGAVAGSLRNDPGRPLQTLPVYGVQAPPSAQRFMLTERNNLLHSGISSFTVADDGTVQVENLITTYQKNRYGDPDNSYLQVETLFSLMFVMRWLRTQITSKFGRMKLARDGTRFAPGLAIVTPSTIRAELIAQYKYLERNGYVQGSAAFAKGVQVKQDSINPNRVNVLWTGTLINQLRVLALINQFRLMAAQEG
ncbi:phage tail protein [Salmonella enterica subsp. enterica serovar Minnesota]|nr:phage tail protein [Salmonella enterica subsp. enterica serovar Minnesota]ECI4646681.1 phage tail protein [Salmonella enterica subsp. salamae]